MRDGRAIYHPLRYGWEMAGPSTTYCEYGLEIMPLREQLRRLGLGGPPPRSVSVLPLELLRGFA